MVTINKQLIPDSITTGDIRNLQDRIGKLKTIGEWKKCVKEFATEHGLTDQEAIAVADVKDF